MQKIAYEDYVIIATAFKTTDGKWIGRAVLKPTDGEHIRVQNPMVFDNNSFDTRMEAEDFALDGAQFFIAAQLKNAGAE